MSSGGFAIPADQREKIKESKKDRQIFEFCLKGEKDEEDDDDTNCSWNTTQKHTKETGGMAIKGGIKTIQTVEIFWKNLGDLRRLAVTHTQVINSQRAK